ncbi:MAG: hypothetical protein HY579_11290 [Nitrospinae bacterium]|nr:hypothetical protein [Nitrospinota bacterium]
MCYAPACYLTNYAEGTAERAFREGELFEGMQTAEERSRVDEAVGRFPEILKSCFGKLLEMERTCHCKDAMLRYKKSGLIGDDWHSWLGDP